MGIGANDLCDVHRELATESTEVTEKSFLRRRLIFVRRNLEAKRSLSRSLSDTITLERWQPRVSRDGLQFDYHLLIHNQIYPLPFDNFTLVKNIDPDLSMIINSP